MDGRALGWILQLLPIAFTYRVRANHEPAVLLLLLAAVLSTERSRSRLVFVGPLAASLCGLVLVKGVIGLVGLPVCALWLFARRAAPGSNRTAWLGLAGSMVAVALSVLAYEALYLRATGQSFLADYLGRQLGLARAPQSEALLAQKAYNFVWYLGRVVWFPFPWSLALLAAIVGSWRAARSRPRADDAVAPDGRAGLVFTLTLTVLYVGLFSLSDRRADRYIFPVYFAVGACGALVALRRSALFRRLAEKLDRRPAIAQASLFLVLFAVHVVGGLLRLPTVKLWPPDS
jgi:hypothetical protein